MPLFHDLFFLSLSLTTVTEVVQPQIMPLQSSVTIKMHQGWCILRNTKCRMWKVKLCKKKCTILAVERSANYTLQIFRNLQNSNNRCIMWV